MYAPFGILGICITLGIAGGAAESGKMWVAAAFAVSALVIFGALLLDYLDGPTDKNKDSFKGWY